VSVCRPPQTTFCCQGVTLHGDGTFHDVWAPSTPDTLQVDGAMTLPTATAGSTFSATMQCASTASLTGTMSAPWNGSQYVGSFDFTPAGGNAGSLSVIGLTWSSSNPAVATVDQSGDAHAPAPGTTTITATYGSTCFAGNPIPAGGCQGVTVASTTLTLTEAGPPPPPPGPLLDAGPDQVVECTGAGCANVTLHGAIFFEPDTPLTYTWTGPFGTASGLTPTVHIPLGSWIVTFVARLPDRVGDESGARRAGSRPSLNPIHAGDSRLESPA
jgi:hypothetical protein